MIHYRHKQIGWPIVSIIGLVTAILIAVTLVSREWTLMLMLPVPLLIAVLVSGTMTVTVTDETLEVHFGVGLLRRRFPLHGIRSVTRVSNPWYYGYGIHFFPRVTVYNIAGFDAVELVTANGRRVRIGTDEPEKFMEALGRAAPNAPPIATNQTATTLLFAGVVTIIALAIAAVVVGGIYLSVQPVSARIVDNRLKIDGGTYSDDVALADITSVALDDTLPPIGIRTNGVAVGETLRGSFKLKSGGSVRLYVQRDHPPFVTIGTKDRPLILSFDDPDRARELYGRLSGLSGR